MSETSILEKTKIVLSTPEEWKVILHNDNVTTMEFVAAVLIQVFNKAVDDAISLTFNVHINGKAVVASYCSFDLADQKKHEAENLAREHNYPLQITVEQ